MNRNQLTARVAEIKRLRSMKCWTAIIAFRTKKLVARLDWLSRVQVSALGTRLFGKFNIHLFDTILFGSMATSRTLTFWEKGALSVMSRGQSLQFG